MKTAYDQIMNGFSIDFAHLDRMQKRIMAKESWVTKEEFLAEPADEQFSYYKWICQQCSELADLI